MTRKNIKFFYIYIQDCYRWRPPNSASTKEKPLTSEERWCVTTPYLGGTLYSLYTIYIAELARAHHRKNFL